MSYTYLIGWSKLNKWYYGVRYAKFCCPSELWVSYFTSSKHVKNFVSKYGKPDVIQIRKVFNDANKARLWESKVLKRLKVITNEKWINKSTNKAIDPKLAGLSWVSMSKEERKLRSQKAGLSADKKLSDTQKKDRLEKSIIGTKNWWNSKSKEERSEHSRIGGIASALKMTAQQKEYRNNRVREVHNILRTCPYCNKIGKGTVMKRWHFDNCKERKKQ